ncbi:MAG: ATP-binding protein, partial [Hyphomicrobiaceae bacterium]
MPIEKISLLHLGKVDGKHEFTESGTKAQYFFDAFLIPESINVDDFLVGDRFIISGFRGTGKTSLLRYLAKQLNDGGGIGQIVLFKTGLSETQKIEISRLSQASLEELISEKIEIAQDFKDAWRWFFHKKIGELLKDKMEIARNNRLLQSYLELLGLNDTPWFEKIMGGFPKLEGTKVKIRGKMPFLEASVEGKIPSGDTGNSILFSEVVNKLDEMIARIGLSRLIYIYVDELEVFFHTQEQYRRDLRLVRDLLFAAEKMVQIDARAKIGLRVCVAVRSEVLDALGAEGQEVTRLAHDCGVNIAWHYAKRGLDHPLIEMVRKKVWASEKSAKIELSEDPIETYFPTSVKGIPLDAFLLDQSFYKPRDLVWRLTIAQRFSPAASKFDEQAFTQTDVDYSAKLWDEILYELSA